MAKSIAKDKLHRFQSSKDLLAALEKIPHGERRGQYVKFRFDLHLVSAGFDSHDEFFLHDNTGQSLQSQ
jgi:hypothetical protein